MSTVSQTNSSTAYEQDLAEPEGSSRRVRPWLRLVAIVAILSSVFVVVPASPAVAHGDQQGHATPDSDGWHPWVTNGCTAVPDRIWGVMDFNHACDHHDGCYGGHWQSRWGCDVTFYYNMERSCVEDWQWWHPSRGICRGMRNTYFSGVRALGYVAYNGWSISGPSGW